MTNEFAALDFDTACAYRILRFENERERDRFEFFGKLFGGGDDDGETAPADEASAPTW